jgi:hypothetical protein
MKCRERVLQISSDSVIRVKLAGASGLLREGEKPLS